MFQLRFLFLLYFLGISEPFITLQHLSTDYLPISYSPKVFKYNKDAAEQCAFDKKDDILYVVGQYEVLVYCFKFFLAIWTYISPKPRPYS